MRPRLRASLIAALLGGFLLGGCDFNGGYPQKIDAFEKRGGKHVYCINHDTAPDGKTVRVRC